MTEDPIHIVFDVSVLFESVARAQEAWARVFKTQAASAVVSCGQLNGTASLIDRPMPGEQLDLRLLGEGDALGEAYVGMSLGLLDQVAVRAMTSAYPDPWASDGRLRIASLLVGDLLALGGHAVVLHKAAALVKPAATFAYELGDVRDQSSTPYLAWLDVLTTQGESGVEARSYGMPHTYGAPNVLARAPVVDAFSIERATQSVRYACGMIALANAPTETFAVPLWYVPGRRVPAPAPIDESIVWTATQSGLLVTLESAATSSGHPRALWSAGDIPFELYARALADLAARNSGARGFSLVDHGRYDATGMPTVRILCFERAELAFYVTAGFGRVAAASGSDETATKHAEICLYGPSDEASAQRLARVLLTIGHVAITTQAPHGLKDWDGLPPVEGWGSMMVPMDALPLADARPIALRLAVPVTSDDAASFRAGRDRSDWYDATIKSAADVAARWAKVIGR